MAKRRGKQARKTSGAALPRESLAPTRERRRQGPVEDAGTLSDVHGRIGAPYRAIDTLERMTRAGTITAEQRNAGERFREDFARAHLEPLTVPRLDRIPGQHTPLDTSNTVIGAREAVHRALLTLGGMTTPVAEVAWAVLGEGRTIKEWCARNRQRHPDRRPQPPGQPLRTDQAGQVRGGPVSEPSQRSYPSIRLFCNSIEGWPVTDRPLSAWYLRIASRVLAPMMPSAGPGL
jgi:hypothetical protein